jgi:multiple antibiotic resistance protein
MRPFCWWPAGGGRPGGRSGSSDCADRGAVDGRPRTISLVVAEAPEAWAGRLLVSLVICAMALGLFLFLLLTPRLRYWLGQTRERVLQRLMGLLITAVAVQIMVSGLKGCFPILA